MVVMVNTWVWAPRRGAVLEIGAGGIIKYSGIKAKGGGESNHRKKGGKKGQEQTGWNLGSV